MDSSTFPLQPGSLADLGWTPFFQEHFQKAAVPGTLPARVVAESRGIFLVYREGGELAARVAGRMHFRAGEGYPAVGDWVVVRPVTGERKGMIHAVLPRKSRFSRKVAGEKTEEQIVAANVDTVFIVSGLDGGRNFNLRRMERYLTLAWASGANPDNGAQQDRPL